MELINSFNYNFNSNSMKKKREIKSSSRDY